ncbi:hypothetical protein TNIN_184261 [Trichonephila inaurata madagascariensis]|uniref:Uncharacterized protein n=1 Tax=Trichonephila inaurata madagascariensis TaxID=2747483 RepID=A0A8X7CUP6_9ARAC|nr:hypothetical protein TNIN_184261 [Trichonephila inaurata madagascariensis]
MPLSEELGTSALAFQAVPLKIIQEVDSFVPGTVWLDRSFGFGDSREEVLEQGAVEVRPALLEHGNNQTDPRISFSRLSSVSKVVCFLTSFVLPKVI